jgi:hypothetical protein
MLKWHMRREEGHQRGRGVQAKGIIVKIDSGKVREILDRGEKGGDGFRNLAEQSTGEDIVQIGGLWMGRPLV